MNKLNIHRCFRATVLAVILLSGLFSGSAFSQVKSWSVELARTLMERYPNPWDFGDPGWSYSHGHMLEGIDLVRRNGDPDGKYYNYIMRYANHHLGESLGGRSMDNMMAGVVLCWAYAQTGDERYKTVADGIREKFNDYPRTSTGAFLHFTKLKGEFWIDGVFMGGMFLIRYGTHVGDTEYCYNEVAKQLKLAHHHLSKGNNLLYHAWDEDKDAPWADKQTGLSPEVWGEGLGWYSNILVETLEVLPSNHPDRKILEAHFDSLASGLKNFQDQSGCWWNIVDKPNVDRNWTCVSASSYFVYALQKGIDIGLLDAAVYQPVVDKGYKGILTKVKLNEQNLVDVLGTCCCLPVQKSWNDYMNCPKVPNPKEGTSAFLWATAIVEKSR